MPKGFLTTATMALCAHFHAVCRLAYLATVVHYNRKIFNNIGPSWLSVIKIFTAVVNPVVYFYSMDSFKQAYFVPVIAYDFNFLPLPILYISLF